MSRPEWCLFCAQADPPRHTQARGHFDGDPACTPCYNAQSRGGTIGEWLPLAAAPRPEPMPSMAVPATKRKGPRVRVRPGDTVPVPMHTLHTPDGEEVRCTSGAVMGPEMINPGAIAPEREGEPEMNPAGKQGKPLTEEQRKAILAADPAESHESVARRLGVSGVTVGKIRKQAGIAMVSAPAILAAGASVEETEAELDRLLKPLPELAPNPVPSTTAVIPLHVDDETAVALFARLPLDLKARALGTVIQPLLFS